MSFSWHRRAVLDEALPPEYRASHARSCALHVANKLRVRREVVISAVVQGAGVDLNGPVQSSSLAKVLAYLEALRHGEVKLNA